MAGHFCGTQVNSRALFCLWDPFNTSVDPARIRLAVPGTEVGQRPQPRARSGVPCPRTLGGCQQPSRWGQAGRAQSLADVSRGAPAW